MNDEKIERYEAWLRKADKRRDVKVEESDAPKTAYSRKSKYPTTYMEDHDG